MSSGTSTTSASSSLSTSGSDGNGGTNRNTSYFFGFLVTFAVLLVLFIVAGFISRRQLRARRRAAALEAVIGAGDPWVFEYRDHWLHEHVRKLRPVWMERWIEDPWTSREKAGGGISSEKESLRWEDIMPLSASLTRERISKQEDGTKTSEEKKIRGSTLTISSWLSGLGAAKDTSTVRVVDASTPEVAIQDKEGEVDVVVMIAMPRSPGTRGYEFGVTSVPVVSPRVKTSNDAS